MSLVSLEFGPLLALRHMSLRIAWLQASNSEADWVHDTTLRTVASSPPSNHTLPPYLIDEKLFCMRFPFPFDFGGGRANVIYML